MPRIALRYFTASRHSMIIVQMSQIEILNYFQSIYIRIENITEFCKGCESVKHGGDVRGMDAEPEPPGKGSRRAP